MRTTSPSFQPNGTGICGVPQLLHQRKIWPCLTPRCRSAIGRRDVMHCPPERPRVVGDLPGGDRELGEATSEATSPGRRHPFDGRGDELAPVPRHTLDKSPTPGRQLRADHAAVVRGDVASNELLVDKEV